MSIALTCVILAAGRGTRMGGPKAMLRYGASTLVERAGDAARGYPSIVVCASAERDALKLLCGSDVRFVANDEAARGMTHSLRLAAVLVEDPSAALAVLLVDTPLVDAGVLARVVAASPDADVTFPVSSLGRPGHPVIFGPRARALLDELAEGDTLRVLRDDPRLTQRRVLFDDERPFLDLDRPADLERIASVITGIGGANHVER